MNNRTQVARAGATRPRNHRRETERRRCGRGAVSLGNTSVRARLERLARDERSESRAAKSCPKDLKEGFSYAVGLRVAERTSLNSNIEVFDMPPRLEHVRAMLLRRSF